MSLSTSCLPIYKNSGVLASHALMNYLLGNFLMNIWIACLKSKTFFKFIVFCCTCIFSKLSFEVHFRNITIINCHIILINTDDVFRIFHLLFKNWSHSGVHLDILFFHFIIFFNKLKIYFYLVNPLIIRKLIIRTLLISMIYSMSINEKRKKTQ